MQGDMMITVIATGFKQRDEIKELSSNYGSKIFSNKPAMSVDVKNKVHIDVPEFLKI